MSNIKNIKVFTTAAHPCSYLEEQQATTIFIDPEYDITTDIYVALNDVGFRRSGKHFYKPHCDSCSACIPCRIPVHSFKPGRRHLRVAKKNSDLDIRIVESIASDEHYQLYASYIAHRHQHGDMFPPSQQQYRDFIGDRTPFSRFVEFRLDKQLCAVTVLDELPQAYSAIYTYFDPAESKRSLGIFGVLSAIELAKRNEKAFLYLGYWIRDCQKMAYKTEYRPVELYIRGNWRQLT